MQLEIKSRETIKPYHPTPENKRLVKLSLLDQFSPHIYVRAFFFYLPNNANQKYFPISNQTIEHIKTSLSKALTSYYPYAGRISKGGCYIDCNDEGIELFEAHLTCRVTDIIKRPRMDEMSKLFPLSGEEAIISSNVNSLALIQITTFDCGGMAIGICFSHKIADGSGMVAFLNDWASIARNANYEPIPKFDGSSFFPPCHGDNMSISPHSMFPSKSCLTTRLVFDVAKIDSLRNINDETGARKEVPPTRFETTSAIICISILRSFASLGLIKPNFFNVIVDTRRKLEPPLSPNHVGNFSLHNLVENSSTGVTSNWYKLVTLLRDGIIKFDDMFVHQSPSQHERSLQVRSSYQELETLMANGDNEMIMLSNCYRLPLYEVDFGFGKPIWTSLFPNPTKNSVFLLDTRNREGIEAWVSLEEQVMDVFLQDEELLGFASLNPSPLRATDYQLRKARL